ncbi:unnamed protein product, partial [Timema podura]|nr:unnamed protein product [Timema podura]
MSRPVCFEWHLRFRSDKMAMKDEESTNPEIVDSMDQMKLAMFLSGLVMFCLAPRLSSLFFYLCGIIVGISTSLLLLFYLVHKMLPKSRLLYGLALGCSTLGIFVFHSLWQYVHSIIFEYSNQVLTYILVTGLVSFVMCYRMGPPTDPRSRNIIKWTIQ